MIGYNNMKWIVGIFTVLVLLLSIWACSSIYISKDHFDPPLAVKLIIRNDDYGDGYFGAKRSSGRMHKGVDLLADVGTPILAAKPGIVKYARYKKGNGKYVVIRHKWGYTTYYCHLKDIDVSKGQRVKRGQMIGTVGKTGNANRSGMLAHLHFEIHKDDVVCDPWEIIYTNKGNAAYARKSSDDKNL